MFKFEIYNLPFHGVRLPEIEIDNFSKQKIGASTDCSNFEYLSHLCYKGFENRIKNKQIDPEKAELYTKRCKEELKVFKDNDLVDYLLLVYDILSWCDENDIPRGIARGSSAGSLVLYFLCITQIDPLENNLYFTRFLNAGRLKFKIIDGVKYFEGKGLADVDSDISYLKRDKLIEHIQEKYKGKVCKISTLITLSGRILIKEVCKSYLEFTEEQSSEVSGLIQSHFGKVEKLTEAYKENDLFKSWTNSNTKHKECFDIACQLQGLNKARGVHPSGISISYYKTEDCIPTEISSLKEEVSSYDMNDISEINIKLDILGLKNVDINYNTCKLIGLDPNKINVRDCSIYEYLKNTDCYNGLFQLECGLTKEVVKKVRPKNINQLSACLSISRPGAYNSISDYLDYVHKGMIKKIHPKFDVVLKETGNVLLYQEQINKICLEIYGLSEYESDDIRRIISKKLSGEMERWEPILYQNGLKNNVSKETTKYFLDICYASSDYLFNENHCLSYSYMTAINTYLKANYPKQFYLSLLDMAKNEPNSRDVFGQIYSEMIQSDIKLLPPHILKSEINFKIEDDGIRFGLGSIKSINEKTIDKLQNFRSPYSNKFQIFQAANECKIPTNVMTALIMVGSLDDMLTETRSKTMMENYLWNLLTEKEKSAALKYGPEFKFDLITLVKSLNTTLKDEKGKQIIKDSRLGTIRKHFEPLYEIYKFNSRNERFCCHEMELRLLGFSYTTTLFDVFREKCTDLMTINEANSALNKENVHIVGRILEFKEGTSLKKNKYWKALISDGAGSTNILLANSAKDDKLENNADINDGAKPKVDDIVIIRGQKGADIIFARTVTIQKTKILEKISQLKDG